MKRILTADNANEKVCSTFPVCKCNGKDANGKESRDAYTRNCRNAGSGCAACGQPMVTVREYQQKRRGQL